MGYTVESAEFKKKKKTKQNTGARFGKIGFLGSVPNLQYDMRLPT